MALCGTAQHAVWHCNCCRYVLKRLFVEKGEAVKLSGLREAYFGKRLAAESASTHVARFVEYFLYARLQ